MVELREVTQDNFYDCIELERKSNRYVGNAESVLAEAYIFRDCSTAYAIYHGDKVVGLVIIMDKPEEGSFYSFTDLFIADGFQGQHYGGYAVDAIIRKLEAEGKRDVIEIQVHNSNTIAKELYLKRGFVEVGNAKWDESFLVMQRRLENFS